MHRPRYDDWSLPKGKLDAGETHEGAATREVLEETGYEVELGRELASTRYPDARGRKKTVRYWAMTVTGGSFVANHETDEVRWLPVLDARARLTYEHDIDVLDSFVERGAVRPAAGRRTWWWRWWWWRRGRHGAIGRRGVRGQPTTSSAERGRGHRDRQGEEEGDHRPTRWRHRLVRVGDRVGLLPRRRPAASRLDAAGSTGRRFVGAATAVGRAIGGAVGQLVTACSRCRSCRCRCCPCHPRRR